jgi:hypothetical protein
LFGYLGDDTLAQTAWLGLAMNFSRSFMNSRSYVHMQGRKEGTDGHKDRRFYLHFDILVPSPASKKAENKKHLTFMIFLSSVSDAWFRL